MTRSRPVIGIIGWKKSGKTTLVVRLIEVFTSRGLTVATVKHAHHAFEIDDGETDSARHRRAGAGQVAIVSSLRWALVAELGSAPEPELDAMIGRLAPCDLVIVEGYKSAAIPKIECRRQAARQHTALDAEDAHVIAIAAQEPVGAARLPVFDLDDPAAIADFITARLGLPSGVSARQ
jgi:molybdopterin-guanine dinucleotide biosynthesis protein B